MRFLAVLVLALLALPAAGPASADDEGDTPLVRVTLGQEDVGLENFLRVISKVTGVPLVWNPQDKNIRGTKLIGNADLTAPSGRLFHLVRSLLTFYELVLVPIGPAGRQLFLVRSIRRTSSVLRRKPEHIVLTPSNVRDYERQDGHYVTTVIPVEHMTDLLAARNALIPVVSGQNIGHVDAVPEARAFVVTDFAPNVARAYWLIKEMDGPSGPSAGKTVAMALKHARAADVVRALTDLFAHTPRTSRRSAPRITAVERTNQVLVSGRAAEIRAVRRAIAELDVPVAMPRPRVHLVRLVHIRATEAASTLTHLMANGNTPEDRRPVVVAHQETNALLISASQEAFARLRALLDEMDAKAP